MSSRCPRGGPVLWNRAARRTAGSSNQGNVKCWKVWMWWVPWMHRDSPTYSRCEQNSQPPEDHSPISRKEFVRFLLATPTKSELRCQVRLRDAVSTDPASVHRIKLTLDSIAVFRVLISAALICPDLICVTSISRWRTSAAAIWRTPTCAAPIWSGPTFLEPTWM